MSSQVSVTAAKTAKTAKTVRTKPLARKADVLDSVISQDSSSCIDNPKKGKSAAAVLPAPAATATPTCLQDLHKVKPVKLGVGIGTTYTLSAAEIKRCYNIAKARNDANIAGGSKNMNYSKRDDVMISFQGMCGEFAFLKLLGQDESGIDDTTCRNAMNDSFDANLEGHTVDVKTVIRPGLDLLCSMWKAKNAASLFAMVLLNGLQPSDVWREDFDLSVTFLGLCPGDWMFQKSQVKKMFAEQKEFYHWPQSQLVTWDYLQRLQTTEELADQTERLMAIHTTKQESRQKSKLTTLHAGSLFF